MPPLKNVKSQGPKDFKGTGRRMIGDFKNQMPLIIIVILLAIFSAILTVLHPSLIKDLLSGETLSEMFVFDLVAGGVAIEWDLFFVKFGTLFGIAVAGAILSWCSEYVAVFISSKYAKDMRKIVYSKLDKLPLSYYDKVPYGDTLSVATNDVDNIASNLQQIITQLSMGVTLFFGSIIAMFIMEWRLALVAIASLPLSFIIIFLISKFSGRQFVRYRKDLGQLNGQIEENYAGYKIIKLFNKENDVEVKFQKTNLQMEKSDMLSQFLSGLIYPTTNFVNNLCYVGVAIVGGVIAGQQSADNVQTAIAAIISFFLYLNMFNRPLQQIGQIMNLVQTVVASGERIYSLLDEEEETPDPFDAIDNEELIKGEFEFSNVSFSYSKDKELIKNLNLKIKPGDTVAIVGPTGAGKTTLVNLIMRFYEINEGKIKLDGVDIRNFKRNTLRGSIGMVLQDTWLFKGTLKENLLFGDENATDEEIIEACKQAHISHFIETLPGGYGFMLNEEGTNLSQGQRQLVTIARAMISKPKIMILDEATSSVDTRTEQQIQDALNKTMVGKTSFVIAHRLSTIKNAKLILVMKKGNIVEAGNHQGLLAQNGFYAELYNAQFAGTNPMEKQEESVLES